MKAAYLLTDSIYSLAVSDSNGTGAEVLGLGFAGVGEVVGGDRMTGVGSARRGGVSEVSIGIGSRLPELALVLEEVLTLVPELVLALVPEQVLAPPIVTCLPQMSWHPTRGPVFLQILPSLGSSLELSASEGSATTP